MFDNDAFSRRNRWDSAAVARLRANLLLGAPMPDEATKHRSRQQGQVLENSQMSSHTATI